MTRYTATFSTDDEITRTSHNDYTHAWALYWDGEIFRSGFAGSRERAEKAGNACRMRWVCEDPKAALKRSANPAYTQDRIDRTGGCGAWEAKREADLAATRVEVVEAIRA